MTKSCGWTYEPGHALSLVQGKVILLSYRFGPDTPKPYMHPLRTPGGISLTSFQPSDHVWHRGLWFAWKFIDGINYWEEEMASDGALVSQGRTLPHGAETVTFAGDGSATLRHPLAYVAPDGRKVLQENRTIVIRPPDGRNMVIDFDHDFRVGDAPITLSATPDTAKTPWGGYSGLGLRAARSLTDCQVVNDSGQTGSATNGARAVWVDLSGIADGGPSADRVVGLALIDHPGNPRYPSPSYVYYNSKDFGYINPSLLRHEAMTLDAGQALRLAYRAVAHDGAADANRLRVLADQFGATRYFDE